MTRSTSPTKSQRQALLLASSFGRVVPIPGGYWVDVLASGAPNMATKYAGEWVGALSVRACERRGWLRRAGEKSESWMDARVITPEGRAALEMK